MDFFFHQTNNQREILIISCRLKCISSRKWKLQLIRTIFYVQTKKFALIMAIESRTHHIAWLSVRSRLIGAKLNYHVIRFQRDTYVCGRLASRWISPKKLIRIQIFTMFKDIWFTWYAHLFHEEIILFEEKIDKLLHIKCHGGFILTTKGSREAKMCTKTAQYDCCNAVIARRQLLLITATCSKDLRIVIGTYSV